VCNGLGRQTTIPAADAPRTNEKAAGTGDIKIGYYDDDAVRSITRDGVTTTIERDTAGRRLNLTTGTSNESSTTRMTPTTPLGPPAPRRGPTRS